MTKITKTTLAAALAAGTALFAGQALAQDNPTVGGAPMMADMDIVDNAVNSPIHTTLVAAVQAAGLVDTLKSEGPFTVFAPVDDAFAALPEGMIDTLLREENRDQLTEVLTAHVVPGRLTSSDLLGMAGSGTANLTTVSGDALSVGLRGGAPVVYDESGNIYAITIPDVIQSNGVIHVVDGVLLPQ